MRNAMSFDGVGRQQTATEQHRTKSAAGEPLIVRTSGDIPLCLRPVAERPAHKPSALGNLGRMFGFAKIAQLMAPEPVPLLPPPLIKEHDRPHSVRYGTKMDKTRVLVGFASTAAVFSLAILANWFSEFYTNNRAAPANTSQTASQRIDQLSPGLLQNVRIPEPNDRAYRDKPKTSGTTISETKLPRRNETPTAPSKAVLSGSGYNVLTLPTVIRATGGSRQILPIKLMDPRFAGEIRTVVLAGIPQTAEVTAASRNEAGDWVMVPAALGISELVLPQGLDGTARVQVFAFGDSSVPLSTQTMWLHVNQSHLSTSDLTAAHEAIASALILFDNGNIAGARERLAQIVENGNAHAAFLYGETFDPLGLSARGLDVTKADVERARFWYLRAQRGGFSLASKRLGRLPPPPASERSSTPRTHQPIRASSIP